MAATTESGPAVSKRGRTASTGRPQNKSGFWPASVSIPKIEPVHAAFGYCRQIHSACDWPQSPNESAQPVWDGSVVDAAQLPPLGGTDLRGCTGIDPAV